MLPRRPPQSDPKRSVRDSEGPKGRTWEVNAIRRMVNPIFVGFGVRRFEDFPAPPYPRCMIRSPSVLLSRLPSRGRASLEL